MCGIAGILTARADLDLDRLVAGFLPMLRHRGPDDEGTEVIALAGGYRLGLAHTRLSILDLSPAGHQPMHDPESGSWITFNGEIYNHQEVRQQLAPCSYRSTSDTETILKAWSQRGDKALDSLRGMFAFGLYDGRRQQFWLVRDRLGIKPLYVTQVDRETWMFASELRALLSANLCSRRLNTEAVESYLAFGAVTAPLTLLEGVESLLPGESMCFDLKDRHGLIPQRQRYWRLSFAPADATLSHAEALERIRPVLLQAVSLRMVSDVPVGVFLSGGIDSSSVVAALLSQGHSVRTFSVIFDEPQFDESEHSRLVARQFATKHVELVLRPDRILAEFDKAITAYDQPSIDGLNTYFISQESRQTGIKVALSGLGGDELFAGYPYFRLMARLEHPLYRQFARWGVQALRYLAPRSTRTIKLRAILDGNGTRLAKYAICRQVLALDRRQALLGRKVLPIAPIPSPVREELEEQVAGLDPVNAQSLLELSLYMGNMLLRDLDQMSMAHSLEVREPLLDHVLVETVAGIPGRLKLKPGRSSLSKDLLVESLPTPLPRAILQRRKMGFVFPWERWLRGELRQRISAVLLDRPTLTATGLDAAAVQQLWNDYLNYHPGVRYTDILCLVHLLYWAQEHRLNLNYDSPHEGLVLGKKLRQTSPG